MDFQVHDESYFVNLGEDEHEWKVFVSSPTGVRSIPVYVDVPEFKSFVVIQEQKQRMPN